MPLPVIVLNPRDDPAFAALVGACMDAGVTSASAMQDELRQRYPDAVVRERGLSHEPTVWYVYRDGAWTPTGTPLPPHGDGSAGDDLRAIAEDLAADAEVFDDIEITKAGLDIDDPRSLELAGQAIDLVREMAAKAEVEERLLRERLDAGGEAADADGDATDPDR
jgi:hypothetical protein